MTAFSDTDRKKILESLTSEQLATFKEAFTVYDHDHDGTITTKVLNSTSNDFVYTPQYLGALHCDEVSWTEPYGCRGAGHDQRS